MILRYFFVSLSLFFILTVGSSVALAAPSKLPNIIYILLDDVGIEDIGVYGNPTIKTPTIDSLASEGMRFTQHYSAGPVCSPTRISFLTGQYPRVLDVMKAFDGESTIGIPEKVLTLPEILKLQGYKTVHAGKWHLGESNPQFLPDRVGFDKSLRRIGTDGDHTNFLLSLNNAAPVLYDNGEYLATTLTDYAVEFINTTKKSKPFFIYLAHLSAHAPYVVPPNFDNTNTGYNLTRTKDKFFAMITQVDQQIARVLAALDARGMKDKTIIIVSGDNGTPNNVQSDSAVLKGSKTKLYEGGIKVPLVVRWPGVVDAGVVNDSLTQTIDLLPTLADIVDVDVSNQKLPGKSLLKVLKKNNQLNRSKPIFWTTKNALTFAGSNSGTYDDYAVRLGSKKLVFQDNSTRLYDISTDPTEANDLLPSDPTTAASLQEAYDKWRQKEVKIKFSAKIGGQGVTKIGDTSYRFSKVNGRVIVSDLLPRVFGDDDFSLDLIVNPSFSGGLQKIASHSGFTLQMNAGRLELIVTGSDNSQTTITGPIILPKSNKRVTVTFYGWKSDYTYIRLYVDGVEVGNDTTTISAVKVSEAPLKLGQGFLGTLKKIKMWPLSLTPEEVQSL